MSYYDEEPTSEHIRETLSVAQQNWKGRNDFIRKMREMLGGENPIEAPLNTTYKVRTMRTYMLSGVINEKTSRFSHLPSIQVIPIDGENFDVARSQSTQLEKAFRSAFYEMERNGEGDVWSKVILDSITLDEGVERIERAPSAFWPEISRFQEPGAIDNYKRSMGLPMRSMYVPLENFFPIYEGPTLVESFEIEYRSLRSVISNPLFADTSSALASYGSDTTRGLTTRIPIVMYCNQQYFCYFALTPDQSSAYNLSDTSNKQDPIDIAVNTPIYLHSYRHGLGKSLYNTVAGRYGGWKGPNNRIEGVSRGLLDLNQKADEMASQVLTNVRARYWPTLVHKVDYERRGIASGSPPKPLTISEGQNIAIFKDEEIEPIFKAEHDEAVVWLFDLIKEQVARLGGSASLYGSREPGVDTGYQIGRSSCGEKLY